MAKEIFKRPAPAVAVATTVPAAVTSTAPTTPTTNGAATAVAPPAVADEAAAWAKVPGNILKKNANEGKREAVAEAERRAKLIVEHLYRDIEAPESVIGRIKNSLRASGMVNEISLQGRAEQFVVDAVAQINDAQLKQHFDLCVCTPASVENAVVRLAALDMSPNHVADLAYLIPRWDAETQTMGAQPQPSINGRHDLFKRTTPGYSHKARVVKEQDDFEVLDGTTLEIKHRPNFMPDPSKSNSIVAAYVVIQDTAHAGDPLVVWEPVNMAAMPPNTFYAKAPEKQPMNKLTREAQRQFARTRATAPQISASETMLSALTKGEELDAADQAVVASPITTTVARPGQSATVAEPPVLVATAAPTPTSAPVSVPVPAVVAAVPRQLPVPTSPLPGQRESLSSTVSRLAGNPAAAVVDDEEPALEEEGAAHLV